MNNKISTNLVVYGGIIVGDLYIYPGLISTSLHLLIVTLQNVKMAHKCKLNRG